MGEMSEGHKGRTLDDWIGERVILNLHRGPAAVKGEETVEISGVLQGVDPMGVVVLFYADDVRGKGGRRGVVPKDFPPGFVFYPWRRIEFIQRRYEDLKPEDFGTPN